jgi:hypothetical protein
MKFSLTKQEKVDLLIQVTYWAGFFFNNLSVILYVWIHNF